METVTCEKSSNKLQDDSNNMDVTENPAFKDQIQPDIDIDDLDKVCRICLTEDEITSLHQSKDYPTFVFLLQTCHKSGIPIDNIYPSNICKICSSQLQNISQFIKKLKNTTEYLNVLFQKEYELIENDKCSAQTPQKTTICITDDEVECDEVEDVEETIIIEEDVDEPILLETSKSGTDISPTFKGFKCEPCNRIFNYFTSWQCHMITHEEINKNKCQYCDWISVDEKKYQEHLKTTHGEFSEAETHKFPISSCDDSDSKTKPNILVSLTIDGQLKCNNCEITFKNSVELNKHMSSHNEPMKIECEFCGKKYVNEFSLQLHLDTAHENKDLSQDDIRIKKEKSRKEIKVKEQRGEYNCALCNKQFAFKSGLTRHIQIVHEQSKRFCCDICGEKFTVKNSLKYHLYIHSDSKPYACKLCSKAFRQPAALFRHQRTKHSKEKKFMCAICLKKFKTSKGLESHSLRHTKPL